jgi:uncharacterized protein
MGKSGIDDSPGLNESVFELVNLDRGVTIAARICLAGTSAARRKGLLGVSQMNSDTGLWICPCEAVHTFGMKIPIDAMFLDRSHRVRKISRDVKKNRIAFCFSAHSVVELPAGRLAATGTELNDRLEFRSHIT